MTDGGQAIKAKAMERLKGESEAQEQRKKVTVSPFRMCLSSLVGLYSRLLPGSSVHVFKQEPVLARTVCLYGS